MNALSDMRAQRFISAMQERGKVNMISSATPRVVLTAVQGPRTSQIVCLPNSGSTITAVSSLMAAKYKFNVNLVVSDTFDIRDANNQKIWIVGKTRMKLFLYKKQIFTEVLVSTALPQEEMILGWQQMRDLGILSRHFPTPCQKK